MYPDLPDSYRQMLLRMICHYFNIDALFAEQLKILRSFFQGKNVYFSAPTGYGKSLIFQAIPLIADQLLDRSTATSIIIVISPLHSLMFDQVKYLNDVVGINAAAIYKDQSEEVLKTIEMLSMPHQSQCLELSDGKHSLVGHVH